jgi:anaerobic magnesium-protoporphyrin IX monomethyl ester cyclase
MARVFLLNPPSPEPVRTPLLSFCHLASALREQGHEVALLDASAPYAPHEAAVIAAQIAAFAPDLVGLHLKTLHVQPAYALANQLGAFTLVAGGPHATIVPAETLAHGFRYVIRGEGEDALCELAAMVDGQRAATEIAGLSWIDRGMVRHNAERPFNTELDRLAPPLAALDLFDPAWYGATQALPPAGLLSSRGCPQACTFCSNDVTGRKFRYRSADSVAAEVALMRDQFGLPAFSFFDDSFAVGKRRVRELCDAIANLGTVSYWTCTAHPAHLDRDVLADMKRAGCTGVDLGMESADPDMLVRIGKGVTVERVLDVLGFLDRAAHLTGGFNARGVVVPYPGTELYEREHERFGFTNWWLREPPLAYIAFPTSWDPAEIERAYADDPALDRNFFHHPPHRVAMIRAALAKKASVTMAIQQRRMAQAAVVGVPAAGSR